MFVVKRFFFVFLLFCVSHLHALVQIDAQLHIDDEDHASSIFTDVGESVWYYHEETGLTIRGMVLERNIERVVFQLSIESDDGVVFYDDEIVTAWGCEHEIDELVEAYGFLLSLTFYLNNDLIEAPVEGGVQLL